MSLSDVMLGCPHCKREYQVSLDIAKLSRVTSRAQCLRCKNTFEITVDRIRLVDRAASSDPRRDFIEVRRTPRSGSHSRYTPAGGVEVTKPEPPAVARTRSANLPRTRTSDRDIPRPTGATDRSPSRPTDRPVDRTSARTRTGDPPLAARTRTGDRAPGAAPSGQVDAGHRTMARVTSQPSITVPPAAAPAPAPEPTVAAAPPQIDPAEEWLRLADPGLGSLPVEHSESVAALRQLLER